MIKSQRLGSLGRRLRLGLQTGSLSEEQRNGSLRDTEKG